MTDSIKRRCRISLFCLVALTLCEHPAALAPTNLFEQAATQNARLRQQLNWTFGGKQQRGWHLYVPLINHLLDVEEDADGPSFARALHRWQRNARLAPTGVLDRETWMTIIALWQAQRNQGRVAWATNLIQAPASDFFDPTRQAELRYVDRATYEAYQRLLAAAQKELKGHSNLGVLLKIISAHRSPAYQAVLRQHSPRSGRAGLAVNSPHFTGRALDLYVGGEPVNTADHNRLVQINTPVYRWLVKRAAKFGFYPYFYEPWHWEYRG